MALEVNKNVSVAYHDVSKSFDMVWIIALFFKLYEMRIKDKTWRLLYRTYIGFLCKVRVQNSVLDWYLMGCEIHHGAFLSLFKYTCR